MRVRVYRAYGRNAGTNLSGLRSLRTEDAGADRAETHAGRNSPCAITQPLPEFEQRYPRDEGMARAHLSGQHSMAAIARHFGVHYSTVSRAVKHYERTAKG